MLRASFPVPEGVILTTTAFHLFLNANALDATCGPDVVATAPLPPDIRTQLRTAVERFGDAALAVRSSGIAEDLPDASFAGQYQTVLDVHGFEALSNAVRLCWASAFSERVTSYRATKGETQSEGMAILIQRLIHADAAGVAFSANPVTGDRQECVVNAVRGLGERLVSGQATPDEWVLREDDVVRRTTPEDAITADHAREVAELARRAETHFGVPQDIEWALHAGQLFLLQTRPITALPDSPLLPVPIPINPPSGFWERESAHFPDPLTPMIRSALLPIHERAIYRSMEENSILIDGVQFREIGGWLYQRVVPLGGKDQAPPPAWLMPLFIRLSPTMRRRIKGLVNVVRIDKLMQDVEQWYTAWKPDTIERIHHLKQVEVASLPDRQLVQHLDHVLAFIADCLHIHALVTAADFLVAELALTCQNLLGWDGSKSLKLLSGLSSQTIEPTARLSELVQHAQKHPGLRQLLDHIDQATPERLAAIDAGFAASFDRYLHNFGHRTLRWDLHEETLRERPELVLRMIRDQIARNYDLTAESAALEQHRAHLLAEARHSLSTRSADDKAKFERALLRATRAYPIREEHEYYLSNVPLALFRYALLEVGRRLTDQGNLDQPNDIFYLEYDEAKTAFLNGLDRKTTVIRRKGQHAWAKAHPGPAFYGEPPPPPPSMAAFPPEAQHVMRVMAWLIESLFASQFLQQRQTHPSEAALTGLAASPGQYTGPVRIIRSEAEFFKLRAGDVLVCPTTQPPWSVLFPSVGALVTDSGGILSHPAIIAREYHVPAVVATNNATNILHDGQVVTVDGNTGRVEVVKP
jgi:pyruvate,water dikinase